MFQKIIVLAAIAAGVCAAQAQEPSAPSKPQVRVNMLNVCSPSQEEQQQISAALSRTPKRPSFGDDFEVDRGRSVLDTNANPLASTGAVQLPTQQASAQFVRIRRDFPGASAFSSVQYSFSRDSDRMVETLVFRVRDPKDLLELSIESSASSVTSAATMLAAATPAGRIKLERFGKSSVVLARCSGQSGGPPPDQSAYEPLFSSASSILSDYRGLLGAKKLVPEELARIGGWTADRKKAETSHRQ